MMVLSSSKIDFTVKPDALLMTTLQSSTATLVFWLKVWAEHIATCASKFQIFFVICKFQILYLSWLTYCKLQSYNFTWEKGTIFALQSPGVQQAQIVKFCIIFATNSIQSCELHFATCKGCNLLCLKCQSNINLKGCHQKNMHLDSKTRKNTLT